MANLPDHEGPADPSFFLDGLSLSGDFAGGDQVRPLPPENDEFVFVRELGRGGMGVVYEAIEKDGGRRVAVKVVLPNLRLAGEALRRFELEARSAAALVHRNCVFVYGAHRVQDSPAISMELLALTLEDRLRSGEPIELRQALLWTDQALRGLEAAHGIGLVHRDVKPSNVFLAADGQAKIGDFGLTRDSGRDLSLTHSGHFLGSPLYASPEQLRGRTVDARSDLYSTGALLYSLVTGRAPHQASSFGDLIARIATEEPATPSSLRSDIPLGLDAVIMKALAKEASQRYQDCAAFRQALSPFLAEAPRPGPLAYRLGAMFLDFLVLAVLETSLLLVPEPFESAVSVAIYLLYFGLLEGKFGCSLGKMAMGLRVTTTTGAMPGFFRALGRAAFLQIRHAAVFLPELIGNILAPSWLLGLFLSARRRNGFRGLHEFATGTRVIAVGRAHIRLRMRPPFEPQRSPSAPFTAIGRFEIDGRIGTTESGVIFSGRDPRLGRTVWIHHASSTTPQAELPDLGELRRLERTRDEQGQHDVYENPGGASPIEYLRAGKRLDWTLAREALVHLLEATDGAVPALNRLWIDRDGHLRILALPLTPSGTEPIEDQGLRSIITCFLGSDRARDWPTELPTEAASLLPKLMKAPDDATRTSLGRRLAEINVAAPGLRRGRRALQLLLAAIPPVLHFVDFFRRVSDTNDLPGLQRAVLMNGIVSLGLIALPLSAAAWFLRGGPGFSLLKLRLVNAEGEPASRGLAAARAALTWAPLGLASLLAPAALSLGLGENGIFVTAGLGLLAYPFVAFFNLLRPYAGLQDALLGTSIERRPR